MNKTKAVHYLLCFVLLFFMLAGLVGNQVALAAQEGGKDLFSLPPGQEEPPPEETLELESKFPVLSAESGEIFEFDVQLKYQGAERKRFEFNLITPPDWRAIAVASYPEKQIPAIEMGPAQFPVTETIKIQFGSPGKLPEPGDYLVILEISSGALKNTIELKGIVTARYELAMFTTTGRLNTEATAGKDSSLSILLINSGSAAIENITFSSSKPQGWNVTYSPKKVDSLDAGLTQEVNIVISPPSKTIAGDYEVTIRAEGKEISPDSLKIRVTVLTPTIWGWIGVLIVLAVIAGVGVIFWRLGRR